MAESVTATNDTVDFVGSDVGDIYAVALQEKTGTTAQNFTWEIQYSLDAGTTYTAYADGDGTSRFTGDASKEIRLSAKTNRVKIIAIGSTSKTVFVEIGESKR